ncbi:major facilitator superfamily domain-containing protein [Mycena galopus ATCC 62051]|nr:major facilitator superfamily domain-containing protein [Mycena galopus ATCC 62051]
MGVFSLIDGFIRQKIPVIVLRALMGAGGALTIPSAQHLIVHMYPDPAEQAQAVTLFGGIGAIGATVNESRAEKILRFRRLDLMGVFLFTAASILFIFSITSGSVEGWRSARVITPLILSFVSLMLFFLWESRLPDSYAAVPSKMWKYENFSILIFISFAPFAWWASVFLQFSWLWEVVYLWSPMKTAVHFLPIGLGLFPGLVLFGSLQSKLSLKWVIFIGFLLICMGTLLLPFANSPERFWPFAFPGFLLATAGAAQIYATTNVALLAKTPRAVSGIVSAIFVCVLQMGGALGSAILTSIQTSVQASDGGATSFKGRAAGLWFLFAFLCTMAVLLLVFMQDSIGPIRTGALVSDPDVEGKISVDLLFPE